MIDPFQDHLVALKAHQMKVGIYIPTPTNNDMVLATHIDVVWLVAWTIKILPLEYLSNLEFHRFSNLVNYMPPSYYHNTYGFCNYLLQPHTN